MVDPATGLKLADVANLGAAETEARAGRRQRGVAAWRTGRPRSAARS